eukprot:scaffold6024_cov98-Amphora_coffeaeformis.AAC.1
MVTSAVCIVPLTDCRVGIPEFITNSALPFAWLTQEILADPYEKCNEHLVEVGIGRFIHEQFCTRSGRTSGIGGRFPRHQ